MEERKRQEIAYYDREAAQSSGIQEAGSRREFDPFLLEGYRFLRKCLEGNYKQKTVLDYGCGTGLHLPWLSKSFKSVVGIDLSEVSLQKAREKKLENVTLVVGDCEKLPFPSETFDVVFDGGTLSSLELENALREVHRVLKPGGLFFGIETLGHNPITNMKRKLNEVRGRRTSWAARHIFKLQDIEKVSNYFTIKELRFFHLVSWIAIPFLSLPGGKQLLALLQTTDHGMVALLPFLKRYSFKAVFVFEKK